MKRTKTKIHSEERVESIIRHITNPNFTATECCNHPRRSCFLLLNNYDHRRFHCLYAKHSLVWKSYTIDNSCNIPEHFYEMIMIYQLLGNEYVLPWAGHFREYSGYTVGQFHQTIHLYPPRKIKHECLKETAYCMLVIFCAVCRQLGGMVPDLKEFSFLYTEHHPVLCDIGSDNVEKRIRISRNQPYLSKKKWKRVLLSKKMNRLIQYMKVELQPFFNQKKKKGRRCVLNETEECFDTETHQLMCQSKDKPLVQVLEEFSHLMPNTWIRENVIKEWTSPLMQELGMGS